MAIIYKTFRLCRIVFCTLFVCFLCGLTALPSARAQTPESAAPSTPATTPVAAPVGSDIYTVEGLKVDVSAASALAARDQAFEKAQVDAFTVLAGRMLPESEMASFKAPDAATVSTMIKDYEVTAEKLSSVRYIGTYTIRFRPKSVERFFNVQGQSYTNVVASPTVILPFYQKQGRTYLWSPYNAWMRAWNRSGQGGSVPVIVPIGDLEDVRDIGDEDVFSYDPSKLSALKNRYGASDAAIALLAPDPKLANLGDDDFAVGGITVSLYRTDRGQPEQVRDIRIKSQANETYGRLLDRAVEETKGMIGQNWKERTVVAAPAAPQMPLSNKLTARVKIQSLQQWSMIQTSLSRVSSVTGTTLKSLSPKEATVDIMYRGDEQMLRSGLAQAGMTLSHPQYAGYSQDPTESRLIYDLVMGGAPTQPSAYQAPGYQPPSQRQPLGGGYQSPRLQLQNQVNGHPPGGYPLPPRGNSTYNGRF